MSPRHPLRSAQPHHQHAHDAHSHEHGRHAARNVPRPQSAARPRESGYTFAHAGRQVRLGPVAFWIFVGTVVIMAGWSAVTATYFAFRDDVLTRLVARQADMQYAYEDRIAELRGQIDRVTSRQMLDQEQFEKKLDLVTRRQAVLESRAAALSSLPDTTVTGSVKPQTRASADAPVTPSIKPSPISDTVIFVAPPDREARLESRGFALASAANETAPKASGMDGVVTRLNTALDRVERRQFATLASVEENYDSRLRRLRGVFTDLGLDANTMETGAPRGGMGGPFVPVKPPADSGAFERQLYRISLGRAQMERLKRTLTVVPYRKPVVGEVEFTSGFGVRTDPFLGRPAMHTGLDFRAGSGDPVRATAAGKVTSANWAGGYGRMIEVDHGNGLATRYGHLSQIDVKVGETIRIGQVIGEVGSTGRSTGPHLHYETRIDGEAVDPQKFLRAGIRLGES